MVVGEGVADRSGGRVRGWQETAVVPLQRVWAAQTRRKQRSEGCRTLGKQLSRKPSKPLVFTTIQKEEHHSDDLWRAGNIGNVRLPFSGNKNRDYVTTYHALA